MAGSLAEGPTGARRAGAPGLASTLARLRGRGSRLRLDPDRPPRRVPKPFARGASNRDIGASEHLGLARAARNPRSSARFGRDGACARIFLPSAQEPRRLEGRRRRYLRPRQGKAGRLLAAETRIRGRDRQEAAAGPRGRNPRQEPGAPQRRRARRPIGPVRRRRAGRDRPPAAVLAGIDRVQHPRSYTSRYEGHVPREDLRGL
jgi:hypothetical protein